MCEEKELNENKRSHVRNQWIISFLANIPVLTYGIQAGWVSPMAIILQSDESPVGRPVTSAELSWVASAVFLAAIVSPPFYSYAADKYGRKIACLLISVTHTLAWLLTLFGKNVATLIVSRALSGVAAGGAFCITPMYVKEISEDRVRGATGSLGMVIQSIGFLIIYAMGAYMDYFTIIYAVLWLPLLHIVITAFFVPESPSYLVKIGRDEEAGKNIAWLRGLDANDSNVEREVSKLKDELETNSKIEKLTFKALLTHKPWRNGLIISLVLHGVRGMGGSLVILSYASIILDKSGVSDNKLAQTMTIPAIMILGIAISLGTVDRVGRKPLLYLGYSIMGVALAALGVASHIDSPSEAWSWVPIAALTAASFGYGLGVLSIPYIIMVELFNMQVRATLLGYLAVYIWLIVFINVQTFAHIKDTLGIYTACYIYAAINFLGVLYSVFFVPETKGRSLEDIEKKLAK